MTPFENQNVKSIFDAYPPKIGEKLLQIRELVFEIGANNPLIGKIEETLKWGEPSYLTADTKSGSTLRIDKKKNQDGIFAIYFNCKTTLIEDIKAILGDKFNYEGNRALIFNAQTTLPINEIKFCIEMALSYKHRAKANA